MRTVLVHQADRAVGVAEGDQFLTEQQHAQWIAVWRGQLRREHGRDPVLAHEVTHGRAGPDAADQLVFFLPQHSVSLWWIRKARTAPTLRRALKGFPARAHRLLDDRWLRR